MSSSQDFPSNMASATAVAWTFPDEDRFVNDTVETATTNANGSTMDNMSGLSPEFTGLAVGLYSIIIVLGLTGNLMFCHIVISSAAMRTVTNYFLLNLAVADILITLFCTLNQAVLLYLGYFPFGSVGCLIIAIVQPVTIFGSSFTLVVISIERYIHILHPLKPRMKTSHTRMIIAVIWLASFLLCSPDLYFTEHVLDEDENPQCHLHNQAHWFQLYSLMLMILQYIVPVVVMLYSYTMIVITIWRRRDFLQTESKQMENRKHQMVKSKKKMIKMLMVVVTVYSLCYFPLNIGWLIIEQASSSSSSSSPTSPEEVEVGLYSSSVGNVNISSTEESPASSTYTGIGPLHAHLHTIFLLLALSHVCYNPIIYFWMNARVRYGFLDMFGSIPGIRKCFPKVTWDSPFSRKETVSRYVGFTRQNSGNLSQPDQDGSRYGQRSRRLLYGSQYGRDEPTAGLRPQRPDEPTAGQRTQRGVVGAEDHHHHHLLQRQYSHSDRNIGGRGQLERNGDLSAIELQELCDAEPLMKRVVEARSNRLHKQSVTSVTTELSELDLRPGCCEQSYTGHHSSCYTSSSNNSCNSISPGRKLSGSGSGGSGTGRKLSNNSKQRIIRSKLSSITLPDLQTLEMENILEEENKQLEEDRL